MKRLNEIDIVLALARAQGVLLQASKRILRSDKHDGIRAVGWLHEHTVLYDKIFDEVGDQLSKEELAKAAKLAGDPPPL